MTVMPHPLEPLGADELERAVACVRSARGLAEGVRFVFVELREPDKERLAAWRDGGPVPPREAALVVLAGGETHEARRFGTLRAGSTLPSGSRGGTV